MSDERLIIPAAAIPQGHGPNGHLSFSQRRILALEGENAELTAALEKLRAGLGKFQFAAMCLAAAVHASGDDGLIEIPKESIELSKAGGLLWRAVPHADGSVSIEVKVRAGASVPAPAGGLEP